MFTVITSSTWLGQSSTKASWHRTFSRTF